MHTKFLKPLRKHQKQSGFTIIELMVGFAIGLIGTLVIMQTFSAFEGKKRSTTGISDAQTNGSIATYMVQRELQSAGYGLPVASGTLPVINGIMGDPGVEYENYSGKTATQIDSIKLNKLADYNDKLTEDQAKVAAGENFSALKCDPITIAVDTDKNAATPMVNVDITSAVKVLDGGTANDEITIVTGTTEMGGVPTDITLIPTTTLVSVRNNFGCRSGDVVLVVGDANKGSSNCVASKVTSADFVSATGQFWLDTENNYTDIKVASTANMLPSSTEVRKLSCLGGIRQSVFRINNNQLEKNGVPIISEIVALQAQYGVSNTPNSEIVDSWVNATGATWGSGITVNNRNRIKAVRLALVARNNLLEKEVVSQTCTGTANGPAKVCVFGNQDVTLPDANWANYRYRVYGLIVPLKNILAASPQL